MPNGEGYFYDPGWELARQLLDLLKYYRGGFYGDVPVERLMSYLGTPQGRKWVLGLGSADVGQILQDLKRSVAKEPARVSYISGARPPDVGAPARETARLWEEHRAAQRATEQYWLPKPVEEYAPEAEARKTWLLKRPKVEAPSAERYFETQFAPIYQEFLYKYLEPKIEKIRAEEKTKVPWGHAYPGRWAEVRTRERIEDEFERYLKQYPFMKKWIEKPPAQRGYYPGRIAPPARWLTF